MNAPDRVWDEFEVGWVGGAEACGGGAGEGAEDVDDVIDGVFWLGGLLQISGLQSTKVSVYCGLVGEGVGLLLTGSMDLLGVVIVGVGRVTWAMQSAPHHVKV